MPNYQSEKMVVCPHCNVQLRVPNKANVPQREVTCRKCQNPILIKFREVDPSGPTTDPPVRKIEEAHTVGMLTPSPQTKYPPKNKWPQKPGALLMGSSWCILHDGTNLVGRSPSMLAQHQFDTGDDKSMSREHFQVICKQKKDGLYLVTFKLAKQNVSNTTVDNLPVRWDEEVMLRHGSVIMAGHVQFQYTCE